MAFLPFLATAGSALLATAGTAGSAIAGAAGSAAAWGAANAGALGIGSSILGGAGTLASGIAEQRAAEYNARISDLQAAQASEQGALSASEAMRRNMQEMAAARAGAAENGFGIGGSITDLLQQTQRQGVLSYLDAIYEGRVSATSRRNDAALSRYGGKMALAKSVIGAGSQVMGGVAQFYRNRTQLTNG